MEFSKIPVQKLDMGRGETTSTATTSASQDWAGGAPPSSVDGNGIHYDPYNNQYIYRIGIYGWRKRCLYMLVILLTAMMIINITLTVWIIRVMDFGVSGMGKLRIMNNGLRLEGEAEFLHYFYAAEIRSRKEQPLKFESMRNITLNARNDKGVITNRLVVGESRIESMAEKFTVKDPLGEILFHADGKEVIIATDSLRITGDSGVRFDGSLQTPIIRAEPFQQLRLESPTSTINIKAPEGIDIKSRVGDISATCLKDFKLQSKEGVILLDSEKIELKNLKTVLPSVRGKTYDNVYQLCVCDNGRLFLSPPKGYCQADNDVCV